MAAVVEEIMNSELFALHRDERAADALSYVLALGVTGAPVVSASGELVGVVSMRDLLADRQGGTVGHRMTSPALWIARTATIEAAGRLMGETGCHRLVVCDPDGTPVGVISTIDVVRGLLGMPASHPPTFPHYDPHTGVTWTDDHVLEFERVEAAPDEAGVLALMRGGAGMREQMVWVEATRNIRGRLIDMLSLPTEQSFMLRKVLAYKELRFRAAAVPDRRERERLVSLLLTRTRNLAGAPN